MKVSRRRSAAVIITAAMIGVGVGGSVVAYAREGSTGTSSTPSEGAASATFDPKQVKLPDGRGALDVTPTWDTNQFGLTVGVPTPGDIRAGNLPDLVPTATDQGQEGFLIAKDNLFGIAKNPEEAKEFARKQSAQIIDGERVQKVFGPDGATLIGTRTAGSIIEETSG